MPDRIQFLLAEIRKNLNILKLRLNKDTNLFVKRQLALVLDPVQISVVTEEYQRELELYACSFMEQFARSDRCLGPCKKYNMNVFFLDIHINLCCQMSKTPAPSSSRFSPLSPSSSTSRPSTASRSLLRNLDVIAGQMSPARQDNVTPPAIVPVGLPSYCNSCMYYNGRLVWSELRFFTIQNNTITLNAARLEEELDFDLLHAVSYKFCRRPQSNSRGKSNSNSDFFLPTWPFGRICESRLRHHFVLGTYLVKR